MLAVKRRDLIIDPGPIDLGRQAHQLMPGVDDLIEPGPEQIVRLRRLALLGSHANLRSSANHSSCRGSTAKNEIARFPRLMALNLAISKVLPEPKSIPAQAPMGSSRPTRSSRTRHGPAPGATRAWASTSMTMPASGWQRLRSLSRWLRRGWPSNV